MSDRCFVDTDEIEPRYKVSFWDALILQAAESSGAALLYSEDLAAGQRYGALRVVNPHADSAALSFRFHFLTRFRRARRRAACDLAHYFHLIGCAAQTSTARGTNPGHSK